MTTLIVRAYLLTYQTRLNLNYLYTYLKYTSQRNFINRAARITSVHNLVTVKTLVSLKIHGVIQKPI